MTESSVRVGLIGFGTVILEALEAGDSFDAGVRRAQADPITALRGHQVGGRAAAASRLR